MRSRCLVSRLSAASVREGLSDPQVGSGGPHLTDSGGHDPVLGQVMGRVAFPDVHGLATPSTYSSTGPVGTRPHTLRTRLDGLPLPAGGLARRPTVAPVAV